MGPFILLGLAIGMAAVFMVALWQTFQILRRISRVVWHYFMDMDRAHISHKP